MAKSAAKSVAKTMSKSISKSRSRPGLKTAAKVAVKSAVKKAGPTDKKSAAVKASPPKTKVAKIAKLTEALAAATASPVKPAKKTRALGNSETATESLSKMAQKWTSLFKKASEDPTPYSISGNFEPKTAIMHKVLGWGYVLANRNDRLEVLFRDGIKYLISNYKRD